MTQFIPPALPTTPWPSDIVALPKLVHAGSGLYAEGGAWIADCPSSAWPFVDFAGFVVEAVNGHRARRSHLQAASAFVPAAHDFLRGVETSQPAVSGAVAQLASLMPLREKGDVSVRPRLPDAPKLKVGGYKDHEPCVREVDDLVAVEGKVFVREEWQKRAKDILPLFECRGFKEGRDSAARQIVEACHSFGPDQQRFEAMAPAVCAAADALRGLPQSVERDELLRLAGASLPASVRLAYEAGQLLDSGTAKQDWRPGRQHSVTLGG